MTPKLKQLSEIIAAANDKFFHLYTNINTSIGIMDKVLRQQGMNSDAVIINCISNNKKIVFLLHDEKPETVDIALGTNDGDVETSNQYQLAELDVDKTLEIMTENLVK
ncbi:hypothetical protein [Thalassomonas sp. M1454]|uniref:hypothetical protein n=1 Tax=Thalassomonas sp. M1454 TaxID=2594477 RepID=UPI00117EAB48|nr:hypothetical protein [Thalassomonas sp. M1454]TRX55705.1 hypothetical protein FNN08_08735 [Thalassomonas sp. M1454]